MIARRPPRAIEVPHPRGRQWFWRRVFELSRVNGALYRGDELPPHRIEWPKGTYLQQRLRGRDAGAER